MYQPIQSLPDGPIDIIGDVHGEYRALQNLLRHLGYDAQGRHPQARRLVFVGDLCDRGSDSPAVLDWFRQAYRSGNALMVLGNHELNLLVGDAKDGSGWYFPERTQQDGRLYAPWHVLACPGRKAGIAGWLADMPLVLVRNDIRIVHAAWLPQSVQTVQTGIAPDVGLVEAYRRWDRQLKQSLRTADWYPAYRQEQAEHAAALENPQAEPPFLHATAQFEYHRSRLHPVRALTSGVETFTDTPFYAGARWRFTSRSAWWNGYTDDIPVVIGHYWRNWYRSGGLIAAEPDAWFGARRNVFCIDYSVGARWRDRKAEPPVPSEQSHFRLAALRWPEQTLVFDNGETAATV